MILLPDCVNKDNENKRKLDNLSCFRKKEGKTRSWAPEICKIKIRIKNLYNQIRSHPIENSLIYEEKVEQLYLYSINEYWSLRKEYKENSRFGKK